MQPLQIITRLSLHCLFISLSTIAIELCRVNEFWWLMLWKQMVKAKLCCTFCRSYIIILLEHWMELLLNLPDLNMEAS